MSKTTSKTVAKKKAYFTCTDMCYDLDEITDSIIEEEFDLEYELNESEQDRKFIIIKEFLSEEKAVTGRMLTCNGYPVVIITDQIEI